METIKWYKHPAFKSVLVVLAVWVLILTCPYVMLYFKAIRLDIPEPPGSEVTASYRRRMSSLVWEERVRIPESAFENAEKVQRHYTAGLGELDWILYSENMYNFPEYLPHMCNLYSGLSEGQRRFYSFQLYSIEGEIESAPPGPPFFACLYVKNSAVGGFYTVRLLTIRPSFWAEFNT